MGWVKKFTRSVTNVVKDIASNPVTATIAGATLGGTVGMLLGNEVGTTIQQQQSLAEAARRMANDANYKKGVQNFQSYRDIFGFDPKNNGTADFAQFAGLSFDLTEAQDLLLSRRSSRIASQDRDTARANQGLFELPGSLTDRVANIMQSSPFTQTGFGGFF